MRSLELRIPPVAVVLIVAAGMAALSYAVSAPVTVPARLPVAVALVVAGPLVAMAGVIAFRRYKSTVNPFTLEQSSTLVATGIYRYSRNPMYLGFLLALVRWGVYLANGISAILLPVFEMYVNRFQIAPEERALKEHFGQPFVTYTRSVRRWL